MLLEVEKLDTGEAKKLRIKSYVNRAFEFGLEDQIDLKKLCSMSRSEIVHERNQLRKRDQDDVTNLTPVKKKLFGGITTW